MAVCDLPDVEDGPPDEIEVGAGGVEVGELTQQVHLPLVNGGQGAVSAAAASATPQVTKYYFFNGQRIMLYSGITLYLHGDHLGSTVLETSYGGTRHTTQTYHAFGARRGGTSTRPVTENQYTGQKLDGTGLYYYNARYYDPALGQFVSPDTLVPDASRVLDYNRYMYVRGNPLKYSDPSGHIGFCELVCTEPIVGGGGGGLRGGGLRGGVGRAAVRGGAAFGTGAVMGTAAAMVVDEVPQAEPESYPLSQESGPTVLPSPGDVPEVEGLSGTMPIGGDTLGIESFPLPEVESETYYETSLATGGTYLLRDPVTGEIMRTGRTNNLARREREHARAPATSGLVFEVDRRTDLYAAQRGREQIIHDLYDPPLNYVNPIRPDHENRDAYLEAGHALD